MAISLDSLTRAAAESPSSVFKSISEARAEGARTAFLCHSHVDRTYALGMTTLLNRSGWNVYVDWQDPSMPPKPNRETAKRIQSRISQAAYFLFLATPNSLSSRWCPWEIGFADGVQSIDTILIIPTRTTAGTEQGSEYLDLYRRIDLAQSGSLAVWQPGQTTGGVWLRSL